MLDIELIRNRLAAHRPIQIHRAIDRHAAVAMLLRKCGRETEILLIRRAEHDRDPWSGDLGFPGGRIETHDATPQAAAERETHEEIGLCLSRDNYLGQSDDLVGTYLSIRISCFIYAVESDARFNLNHEVVDYFWVPLATLLDPQRNQRVSFAYRGKEREHPVIHLNEWSERPLWGITYRLIDNFLNLFDLSFTYSERL